MLLKEFLEPLDVSQVEAARRMKIPFQRLNAIIKGRRAVSADTALLLEGLTRWDAQIWLTLQAKWDLWHALRARRTTMMSSGTHPIQDILVCHDIVRGLRESCVAAHDVRISGWLAS
jgi:addiction module HigA family antidote